MRLPPQRQLPSPEPVDKATLIYAETELGPAAIPRRRHPSPYLFERSLTRVTRTTFGPDACVTGYLHDPWPQPPANPSR